MPTATDIHIIPLKGKPTSFLLIAVLEGRGRAYYTTISNRFPTEEDVDMCLRIGSGLNEGGIDQQLAAIRAKFAVERYWEDAIIAALPA